MGNRPDDGGDTAFLLGLLAGGLIGTALGLLLAPKRGAELRSDLSASAGRWQRAAVSRYQQAADRIGHTGGLGREGREPSGDPVAGVPDVDSA